MDMGNNGNAPQIRFAFAQKCETQERLKWWRSLCLHTLTEYISIDFKVSFSETGKDYQGTTMIFKNMYFNVLKI